MKKIELIIIAVLFLTGCSKSYGVTDDIPKTSNTTSPVTTEMPTTTELITSEAMTSTTESTTISTTTSTSTTISTTKKTTSTTKKITTKKKTTTTKSTTTSKNTPTTTKNTTTEKTTTTASSKEELTEEIVRNRILALKSKYPQGATWNDNTWSNYHGGTYSGGWGCVGFAYMASDAAFGTLKHKRLTGDLPSIVRVGDIFRYNASSYGHSVIVLEVKSDRIVVAEGNWQKKVNWGREITFDFMRAHGVYLYSRWP